MDYNIIWFLLVALLLTVYAVLEGFDLGCGILYLFSKNEDEKSVITKSIGPVWDENEVWLVTGGGALFAAFPHIYSSVFSGFYLAVILLMIAIVFRATGIEIRNKVQNDSWKKIWDKAFGISSLLIALLLGTALGNLLNGVPIGADKEINISLIALLNPYSLLIGLTTVALFTLHGNLFAIVKTEGEQEASFIKKLKLTYPISIIFALCVIGFSFLNQHLISNFATYPVLIAFPVLMIFSLIYIKIFIAKKSFKKAFTFSTLSLIFSMAMIASALFPNFVYSSIDPKFNLHIYNSASSPLTMKTMLIIALIGMPLVVVYTIYIYRVFRGKVKPSDTFDY